MKKLIALILAMLLMLCIVACDGGSSDDPKETTAGGDVTTAGDDVTTAGDDVTTAGDDVTTAGDDVTTSGEDAGPKEPELLDAVVVDETVYLDVDGAAYRTAPETLEDNIAGSLRWGASANRVLYNEEWSVIVIEGTKYYLPTECLSTEEVEGHSGFTTVNDTVLTVGTDIVLRTAPIAEEITEQLYLDEDVSLRRVRYSDEWSVVVYENVEYYIDAAQHSGSQGSSMDDLTFDTYTGTLTVTASSANLYGVPSNDDADAEIVASAAKGEKLTGALVSSDGQWYGVNFLNPSTGMMQLVYVKAADVSTAGA